MRRSLRAGRFGRRLEEFVAKYHVEVDWHLEATDLDLAESWLKKRSLTSNLAVIPDPRKNCSTRTTGRKTGAPTSQATPSPPAGTARALGR